MSSTADITSEEPEPGHQSFPRNVARQLDQFWFSPMPAYKFTLFRTGLGAIAVLWILTLLPDLNTFFGRSGINPEPDYVVRTASIFRLLPSDFALWTGTLVGLVAAVLLTFGRLTRIAAPVTAIVITSLMAESGMLWNSGDEVLQTFLVLLALYCVGTPSSGLNSSIVEALRNPQSSTVGKVWLVRLVQLQMSIIYLATFLDKIRGSAWREGTATMTVFRLDTLERFYIPEWMHTNYLVGALMTWGTLAIEGLLPVLLWNKRARPYILAAGLVLHLSIDWSLNIGPFSWVMIVGLTCFLDPENVSAISRWPSRLRSFARRGLTEKQSGWVSQHS